MPTFRNDNNDETATVEGVEAERLTELDNWHEVGGGEAQVEPVVEPAAPYVAPVEPVVEPVEPVVEPEPQPVDANGVLIPTPVEPVEPVEPVVA